MYAFVAIWLTVCVCTQAKIASMAGWLCASNTHTYVMTLHQYICTVMYVYMSMSIYVHMYQKMF